MSEASGKGGRVYVCMTLEKLAVRKGEERREAATFVYGMHPPHLLPALLPPAPAANAAVRVGVGVRGVRVTAVHGSDLGGEHGALVRSEERREVTSETSRKG